MADRLMRRLALVLVSAFVAGQALAQPAAAKDDAGLPDPTRPPTAFGQTAAAGSGTETQLDVQPVLSSVLIPAQGRPRAIIDGRSLGVGELVGEAKIVRITEAGVLLKGPEGTQTLPLTPGIEKKMLRSAPEKRRTGKTTP